MISLRSAILVCTAMCITACAAVPPTLSPELQSEYDTPLYCTGDSECKTQWERAAFFINENAGFKIQVYSDVIIQTYNPAKNSPHLAFDVTKEPLGEGKYQIRVKAWCANIITCTPNQYETVARAKRYIRTGVK